MKRVALLIGVVLLLGACGGGNPEADKVKQVWTTFFSPQTSTARRVAMLQDGPRFRSAITSLENNPFASQISAKVSNVTLEGKTKAKVTFSLLVGNTPAVTDQVGYSYKKHGKWLVGYAGLCKLLALQGEPPAACTSSTP